MDVKTKLSWAYCPAGKWHGSITSEEAAKIKEFLSQTSVTRKITNIAEFTNHYNKIFGTNREQTGCQPCLVGMHREMTWALQEYEKYTNGTK